MSCLQNSLRWQDRVHQCSYSLSFICYKFLISMQCATKGKTCVYTQSRRGGSRIRKRRGSSSAKELKDLNLDNADFNHVPLSILPEITGNFASGLVRKQPLTDFGLLASFSEPLSLVAPGGGLKQYVVFCFGPAYTTTSPYENFCFCPSRNLGLIVRRGFKSLFCTYSKPPQTIIQFSYILPDNWRATVGRRKERCCCMHWLVLSLNSMESRTPQTRAKSKPGFQGFNLSTCSNFSFQAWLVFWRYGFHVWCHIQYPAWTSR